MNTTDREQRFEERRKRLAGLSDEQLRERFWDLCHKAVEPIVELARTHTSPAIERSVLLRMGIDSVSAQGVAARIHEAGLLGKGAGHVLLDLARREGCDHVAAAARLLENPALLHGLYGEK